jgi:hypothetical protein
MSWPVPEQLNWPGPDPTGPEPVAVKDTEQTAETPAVSERNLIIEREEIKVSELKIHGSNIQRDTSLESGTINL